MPNFNLELLPHQAEFLQDNTTKELALIGGRGCGKTYSLALKLVMLAHLQAGSVGAALSPTGAMLNKVLLPELERALTDMNVKYKLNRTARRFDIDVGRNRTTQLFCLSAENVRDGLGLNLAFFGLDEADTMSTEVAFESWRKLSGALRAGDPRYRQKVAVSTPEGYRFCYQHWVKTVDESNSAQRRLIKGKSRDNVYLTDDYFADLEATYPAHYLKAYLEGEFVSMANGPVHPDYSRELNHTELTLGTLPDSVRTVHLGMDFNIKEASRHPYGIAIITAVVLNGRPYVIDELYGTSRTTDAIVQIKKRYPNKSILVYPDASAKGDRTSASDSDRAQLQAAGFIDMSPLGNPRIDDRVNAVNALILNGAQQRRLLVNRNTCPVLSECLAQQSYDPRSSQPEKDTGFDDPVDALGYFVNVNWPVKRSTFSRQSLAV
jgi:hypothetical protein